MDFDVVVDMVQSKKKKKNGDFKKSKSKVGKKKVLPDNFTNTSFKSQTIVVRGQKTLENVNSEETNHRNLTLLDLLGQLKHYNSNVRKDACHGLKDLLELHPRQMHLGINIILEKIAPLLTDSESSVRKSVFILLKYLISNISTSQIEPFVPLLVAHTSSAMTHIRDDIRHDSLQFIDFFLLSFPELLMRNSGGLICNFVNIISSGKKGKGTGQSSRSLIVKPDAKVSGMSSRSMVLSRLDSLLRHLLFRSDKKRSRDALKKGLRDCYDDVDFSIVDVKKSEILTGFPNIWEHAGKGVERTAVELGAFGRKSLDVMEKDDLVVFLNEILPVLKECMIECAPRALSSSDSHSLTMNLSSASVVVSTLLTLCRLYEVVRDHHLHKCPLKCALDLFFPDFCKYFLTQFPVGEGVDFRDPSVVMQVDGLNLSLCEISLYFPSFLTASTHAVLSNRREVLGYLLSFVKTGNKFKSIPVSDETGCSLTVARFDQALETTRKLFKYCNMKTACEFLNGLLDLLSNGQSLSRSCKLKICEFFYGFAESELSSRCDATQPKDDDMKDILNTLFRWGVFLPKFLWNLDNDDSSMSEEILDMIKYILCVEKRELVVGEYNLVKELRAHYSLALGPLFHCLVGVGEDEKDVYGPFVRYQENLQLKLVNLLYFLDDIPRNLMQSVIVAMQYCSTETTAVETFVCLLCEKAQKRGDTCIDNLLLSADISLLVGYSQRELARRDNEYMKQNGEDPVSVPFYVLREGSFSEKSLLRRVQIANCILFKYQNYFNDYSVIAGKLISFSSTKRLLSDSQFSIFFFISHLLRNENFSVDGEDLKNVVSFHCEIGIKLFAHFSNIKPSSNSDAVVAVEYKTMVKKCLSDSMIHVPGIVEELLIVSKGFIEKVEEYGDESFSIDCILDLLGECLGGFDIVLLTDEEKNVCDMCSNDVLKMLRKNSLKPFVSALALEKFVSNIQLFQKR